MLFVTPNSQLLWCTAGSTSDASAAAVLALTATGDADMFYLLFSGLL